MKWLKLKRVIPFCFVCGLVLLFVATTSSQPSRLRRGSPVAQEILASVTSAVASQHNLLALFGAPPAALVGASRVTDRADSWLYLTATAADNADAVVALWESGLIASGYVSKAAGAGTNTIQGASVAVTSAGGDPLLSSEWVIPEANARTVPLIGPDRTVDVKALNARFSAGAAADGEVIIASRMYPVPRLSPSVTLSVSDPERFIGQNGFRLFKIFGDESGYDARLLQAHDRSGAPIMVAFFNHRLQAGAVWVAPRYATAFARAYIGGPAYAP
jgi:hypothetical protein